MHAACSTSRRLGLHETCAIPPSEVDAESAERRKLFWSLYYLDKQRIFLDGLPGELYLFDSDLELPPCDIEKLQNQCNNASLHMMSIWEQVYIKLYSPRASRCEASIRDEQATRLLELCRDWRSRYDHLLGMSEGSSTATVCLKLELRYCYHISHILIRRCFSDVGVYSELLSHARAALGIITCLSKAKYNADSLATLAR